ncbi:hypothetical protein M8C21_014814, partial [Ambrosia artemisiifolia]
MDPSALNNPQLQQLINQEKERAMANEMIAKLTSACWDKCITGTPGSKFSSSESNCLSNCAQRYMDMSMMIVKRDKDTFHMLARFTREAKESSYIRKKTKTMYTNIYYRKKQDPTH